MARTSLALTVAGISGVLSTVSDTDDHSVLKELAAVIMAGGFSVNLNGQPQMMNWQTGQVENRDY